MDAKVDRLFLERDCKFCGVIRAELDMEAVSKDDFRGADGQEFYVLSALSNCASGELLSKYGLSGVHIPVLVCYDGEVRTDVNHILGWLRKHGESAAK